MLRLVATLAIALAAAVGLSTAALANDNVDPAGRRAAPASKPTWEFALTAYPTSIRDGDNYTSGIAVADRGPLHLEARYNYEAVGARSAFVGWTFSGGETVTWEFTPLLGGAWRAINAFIPGFEASLAWKRLDFYIEGEYVRDHGEGNSNYFYAWSELGFTPVEWFRGGLVAQRTKVYGGDRDVQRGPFAQLILGRFTLGAFWFNPGSNDQIFVGSVGVKF
jgi:hypothetical protein